jgi:virulence activator alpha
VKGCTCSSAPSRGRSRGARREAHRRKLAEYEHRLAERPRAPGPWLALEAGIRHEREWVRFWDEVAEEGSEEAIV